MKTNRKKRWSKLAVLATIALLAIYKADVFQIKQLTSEKYLLLQQKNATAYDARSLIDFKLLEEPKNCLPHRHFAFIKTHKTGSTTIFHIFKRYIQKHDLIVAERTPHPFVGGYPGHIKEEFVFLSGKDERNNVTLRPVERRENFVINDHFRFNHTVLKKIMPPETLPWSNFQSAFHYYYRDTRFRHVRKLTCFSYPFFHVAKGRHISMTDYISLASKKLDQSIPCFFRSKNYQSFDLGLDPLLEDENEINKAVEELGKQIDFMMITDHMDESVILLKDLFCMSWSDVLFLEDGSRHYYTPQNFDKNSTVMKKFRRMYKLDLVIYDYFNKTLWKKVDAYGTERMKNDLKTLRSLRAQWKSLRKIQSELSNQETQNFSLIDEKNYKTFLMLKNNYVENSFLISRLSQKIYDQDLRLNRRQANTIAGYMVQNKGSCPI